MAKRSWAGCAAASLLWISAPAQAQSSPTDEAAAPVTEEAQDSEITITGGRERRAEPAMTGSRVAGGEAIGFRTIATDTGVTGLTPGSGMDPNSSWSRMVTETECRSDDPRLSEAAACRLAPVQAMIADRRFAEARAALDRMLAEPGLTDHDRYVAAHTWYRLGEASGDAIDREEALATMLATESMPAMDRRAAMRTLIARALRRGEAEAARRMLEQLIPIDPADARSRANLAAIYAAEGRGAEADALIAQAITIARARGEAVPSDWESFAASAGPEG